MDNRLLTLLMTPVLAMSLSIGATQLRAEGGDGDARQGQRDGERGDKGHKGKRGHPMMHALLKGIELSEEQRESIKEIMKAHHEKRRAFHEANKDKMQSLKAKMKEARANKDKEAMSEAHEEFKTLMQDAPKPTDAAEDIRAELTADQQATFDDNLDDVREKIKQRHSQGKGKGKKGNGEKGGKRVE